MGDAGKQPSLPPNYVSLLQLQERWEKEQEKKQEKVDEKRKQTVNEDEELNREENRNKQGRNGDGERKTALENNRRRFKGKTGEISNWKSEKSQGKDIRASDEPKTEEPNNKKKKKRRKYRQPSAVENPTRVSERAEKIPVVVSEGNGEKIGIKSEKIPVVASEGNEEKNGSIFEKAHVVSSEGNREKKWMKSGKIFLAASGEKREKIGIKSVKIPVIPSDRNGEKFWIKNATIPVDASEGSGEKNGVRNEFRGNGSHHKPVNQTLDIGRSFKCMSLNGKIGGNVRSQKKYFEHFRKFDLQRIERRRESGLVWVRKGERTDADSDAAGR